ncbi:FG-GAP repeat protein [Leptospira yasudae]|uniref:FG-GAP-like repeat-containing protein n=1 Tax=Leptospira yasudae TaxID=2202201 RepID=UPI001C4E4B1A|nr:FG-GAP-like repeat-containing protein [Leptospira yasudae]MBW0432195.1 FG-GAP repeat protein [Leptospira yasudae]
MNPEIKAEYHSNASIVKRIPIFLCVLLFVQCWSNPFYRPPIECSMGIHNQLCPDHSVQTFFEGLLILNFNSQNAISISNMKDRSTVQSGFLVGRTAFGYDQVAIILDDGAPTNIPVINSTWRYALPAQAVTGTHWPLGSKHKISVRIYNVLGQVFAEKTIEVVKGINRDTNGDGYPDVVLTVSPSNAVQGYALVFLSQGETGTVSTSPDSIVTDGLNGGSYFGDRVGFGDFNGDGYADMIVGSQAAPSFSTIGHAYIFHSSGSSGIPSQNLASGGYYNTFIKGQNGGERLGSFVNGGDINSDGYDDAILTSPWNNCLGYLVYSNGSTGVPSKDFSTGGVANIVYNLGSADNFGITSLGDINADGYTDMVVGAPSYNASRGRVYIYMSNGGTLPGTAQYLLAPTPVCSGTCNFGNGLTLADFNGDSCSDLAVGGPTYNGNQGIAFVYYSNCGSTTPYSSVPNVTLTGPSLSTCSGGNNCSFGGYLSSGDTNGDGFADLVIGTPQTSNGYGNVFLFQSAGSTGLQNVNLSAGESAHATVTGQTAGLNFGLFANTQDINGDGLSDILVAAIDPTATSLSQIGKGKVHYFQSSGSNGPGNLDLRTGVSATSTLMFSLGMSFGNSIALAPFEQEQSGIFRFSYEEYFRKPFSR